jgi:hypothetical protein
MDLCDGYMPREKTVPGIEFDEKRVAKSRMNQPVCLWPDWT